MLADRPGDLVDPHRHPALDLEAHIGRQGATVPVIDVLEIVNELEAAHGRQHPVHAGEVRTGILQNVEEGGEARQLAPEVALHAIVYRVETQILRNGHLQPPEIHRPGRRIPVPVTGGAQRVEAFGARHGGEEHPRIAGFAPHGAFDIEGRKTEGAALIGLQVVPHSGLALVAPNPSSGMLVLPTTMAPCRFRWATMNSSAAAAPRPA